MTAKWSKTTRPGWTWEIISQLDDCEVIGGELPRNFACANTAREDAGIWEEVSFVEGENFLKMEAKRELA